MIENGEGLESRLHKWLATQGYPLEMKFAERVRKLTKLSVRQGWHFEDPEQGTSREIDIVCSANEIYGFAEINFVVECKATSKPWVIFSSEDAIASYNRLSAFGIFSEEAFSEIADKAFDLENSCAAAKKIPWLWKEGRVGYSIAQAFEGGGEAPYAGCMSALKASLWLQEKSLWQSAEHRKFVATFPVVVTSSPLFECYLDETGELRLEPIEAGFLFFPQIVGQFGRTCISVVSSAGIDNFVRECGEVADTLMSFLQPAINKEWADFKKSRLANS